MKQTTRLLSVFALVLSICFTLPLGAQEEWSNFLGPEGRGVLNDGTPLKGIKKKPKQIWKSELGVPPGRVDGGRSAGSADAEKVPHSGGWFSPVYANGNIYISTYRPSGNVFDKKCLNRMGISQKEAREMAKKNRKEEKGMLVWKEPNKWAISADDIIACIDAKTGKTEWVKVVLLQVG